jgi:epoxyqueuosine reductase
LTSAEIRELARACGFELAGVAAALPAADRARNRAWVDAGFAGEMNYLTDHRADLRDDPRTLLPSARSIVCVGRLYNTPWPYSTHYTNPELAWISRYAWGDDYHAVMRRGLERLDGLLRERAGPGFKSRICVDTAPLLERSYARLAGLGWIGKNTCLIHQGAGSWFFLGELLVSLDIAPDAPPPDRCGSCRRCIDACPTAAIVPAPAGPAYTVDSRLCISYFTIELRGAIPEDRRAGVGAHVFGCDICQDVCPWNSRAPFTADPSFEPRLMAPPLAKLALVGEREFSQMFAGSAVTRARYSGFLRNVAVAMGNAGLDEFRAPLKRLAESADPVVAEHARWALNRYALARLRRRTKTASAPPPNNTHEPGSGLT